MQRPHRQYRRQAVEFSCCGLRHPGRDAAGRTPLYKRGADQVEFTDDELRRCAGAVLTHNHPLTAAGSAFSPEDVRLALNYQTREMRAVGGRYVDSLRADPTLTWADVQPIYDRANYVVRVDFARRIQTGALRIEDAELHRHHEVWSRVQQRVGADRFQYARREHGYGDDRQGPAHSRLQPDLHVLPASAAGRGTHLRRVSAGDIDRDLGGGA